MRIFNAFGHASALMQELVGAYSTIAEASASSAMCECSPIHRDSACGDPRCRWVRPNFTAERESQDAEYAAAVRADEARDATERQRDEAEHALAGPVQVGVWLLPLVVGRIAPRVGVAHKLVRGR